MSTSNNQIVLVTGANKGIGLATVKLFASKGYVTYIGARNEAEGAKALEEVKKEVPQSTVRFVRLDITSTESIKSAVEAVSKETGGKLDYLINNAGVFNTNKKPSEFDSEAIRKCFDVNFFGTVEVTQLFLPLLKNGGCKVILNVSSDLGSLQLQNYTNYRFYGFNVFAYNTSKTALNGFTVGLSKELSGEGFRVNSVNPGFVNTTMNGNAGELAPEAAANTLFNAAVKEHGTGRFLGDNYTTYPW